MDNSINKFAIDQTQYRVPSTLIGYQRLTYFFMGEATLIVVFTMLFWFRQIDIAPTIFVFVMLRSLLTLILSHNLFCDYSITKSHNRPYWPNASALVFVCPIVNFLAWGFLMAMCFSISPIGPPNSAEFVKPALGGASNASVKPGAQVQLGYGDVTFKIGDKVSDAILPLTKHTNLRIAMQRHGRYWQVGRRGVNVPDFWIAVKDERIWSVRVNSNKVIIQGLNGVHLGDSEQNVVLKLGRAIQNRNGSERLFPSRKESHLREWFSKSKPPEERGFWSRYLVGRDEMEIHYANGSQTANQLVVFQTQAD